MIIYKATNNINGKVYIGQTTNTLQKRINKHKSSSIKGSKKTYFNLAIVKYGFENFIWEEIDSADFFEELDYMEIYWIKFYYSDNRKYGYNLAKGGNVNRNYKWTEKQKENQSKRRKEFFSKKENREKLSKIMKEKYASGEIPKILGKKFSKETIKRMSESKIGKSNYKNIGKKHTKEQNQKHSEFIKNWWRNPENYKKSKILKKIICVETGKVYNSISEAKRELKLNSCHIGSVCSGNRKSCAGFTWKYINEDNILNNIEENCGQ